MDCIVTHPNPKSQRGFPENHVAYFLLFNHFPGTRAFQELGRELLNTQVLEFWTWNVDKLRNFFE